MHQNLSNLPQKFVSIAPLMGYSDRHFRYFIRKVSQHVTLYTEMIPEGALAKGRKLQFLEFHPDEKPLILQVGGSHPELLYECAKLAEEFGFDGINLNAGCPSDKVQENEMGLCLMKNPLKIKACLEAMKAGGSLPVSLKTRLGVDNQDSQEALFSLIETVLPSLDHLTLHARKGWLKGLSPKENRTIPPLQYERVYDIKRAFPELRLGINGGILSLDSTLTHLNLVDEVMIGRGAIDDPYFLSAMDFQIYGDASRQIPPSREEILESLQPYLEAEVKKGVSPKQITRHWLGLYRGEPGARAFRSQLSS